MGYVHDLLCHLYVLCGSMKSLFFHRASENLTAIKLNCRYGNAVGEWHIEYYIIHSLVE